jgi:hypothetical protein
MSHTTKCNGGTVFIHNGDFSGDVEIVEAGCPNDMSRKRISVPFSDVKALVAKWARSRLVQQIENASANEILIGETQGQGDD